MVSLSPACLLGCFQQCTKAWSIAALSPLSHSFAVSMSAPFQDDMAWLLQEVGVAAGQAVNQDYYIQTHVLVQEPLAAIVSQFAVQYKLQAVMQLQCSARLQW
jgi:hypothetical protein